MTAFPRLRRWRRRAGSGHPVGAAPHAASGDRPIGSGLIDVADLIGRYSASEHASRADAYFNNIHDSDKLLRKPFFGIRDTQANMHGVAEVIARLRLFPGARVLDFGAGTGWFSRILAFLECRPVATDVSAKALELGARAFARDPLAAGLAIDWKLFDGVTLPLADQSIDRIICYDSFHHVADQAATLREFHRVLVDGGRIVFHEPGPQHSRIPVSQLEMRHHGVIENDIVVEDIWQQASRIGFSSIDVALTSLSSVNLPLERYNRVIAGAATGEDTRIIVRNIADAAGNLRIFVLAKGEENIDSRHGPVGLGGSFELRLTDTSNETLRGWTRVSNTGNKPWRSSSGEVGSVSLGAKRTDGAGAPELGRIRLSDRPILPGQSVEVEFLLHAPVPRPTRLVFDLVAEEVTWFEIIGSRPVFVDLN